MFLYYIISAIVSLIVLFYLYFSWNNDYWKNLNIPHETPKFFFGNLKDALTGKIQIQLIHNNLYKKFNNVPYFGFYKLRYPAIVVRDLDLVRDVMVKEFNSFADNDFHIDPNVDPVLAGNPFVVTGDEWKLRRSQWSSGMTPNRVKLMFDVMTDKAALTVKYLKEHCKNNPKEPVDVKDLAMMYLTDTIVASVLGLQINSFDDPKNEFKVTASSLFNTDFLSSLKQMCYFFAPWVNTVIGTGFVSKEKINWLVGTAKQVIEIRKKNGFVKNDFFEVLMKKDKVDEMEVAGRVFGFLTEGIETSSGLTMFSLYELAVNPQIQTRLRQEIVESVEQNDGKITYDAIHALPYLDQIVNETLRIHPPIFTINRLCTKSYELPPVSPGGKPFKIPVGMPITVPSYGIGMDPQYFKDPEKFDPERFTEENREHIKKFSFMPFGDGPRICVGQRLGLTNSKNVICNVIKNFEVRLSPKTKTPLDINPNSLVNRPTGDIWLTFHEISK